MSELPESPAAERNAAPILAQLRRLLRGSVRVLEIGSGWGQHAAHFCAAMPGLDWQPSERARELGVLEQRVRQQQLPGLRAPVALDVASGGWPEGPYDAVFSANTAHIMPWETVLSMLAGVAKCLAADGVFMLYGPFNLDGEFTAPSNAAFDRDLRRRDPAMGIRDLAVLEKAAAQQHLLLEERLPMPANNFLLVFRQRARTLHQADSPLFPRH